MTNVELKKEAEAEADKVIIGSGMDRASVIHLKHLLVTMYIQGATKVTKELKTQIEKMKVCQNCDNWNWKHNKCEKKLKGDCFKHSKWVMRNF